MAHIPENLQRMPQDDKVRDLKGLIGRAQGEAAAITAFVAPWFDENAVYHGTLVRAMLLTGVEELSHFLETDPHALPVLYNLVCLGLMHACAGVNEAILATYVAGLTSNVKRESAN